MTLEEKYELYSTDPWAFLCNCVYTKNQVAQGDAVQKFPGDWEYLELYTRMWQKHKRIAVPKSRRMTMSWTNIGLHLWAAMFKSTQDFAFVSKKEDDSAELVRRAEFIYDHIPESEIPRELLPRKKTYAKPPALIFPDIDSKIQGFPMGADQLRQFTFTGILGDECAFWDDAQKFYTAASPTLEGGGRMTLISSRSPGFFQRIVYDQLDSSDAIDETITPKQHYPFGDDSVIIWKNPKNKFVVIDIHYTANKHKREPGFKESVRASMPIKDFMVEYERNWNSFSGKPVYEDYNKSIHCSRSPQETHMGLPLLIGWDFGLTPAAIVCQLREGRLHILKEYVAEHSGIKKFCPLVMADLRVRYPSWADSKRDFRHYIDPAGLAASQTDEKTCAGTMYECGLRSIYPGGIDFEGRKQAVEHFLMLNTREGAGLELYPPDCPQLEKGFSGGYQYPEKYIDIEPDSAKPIKNQFSHPHDALQYVAGGALGLKNRKPQREIPIPHYAFGAEKKQKPTTKEYEIGKDDFNIR